MLSNYRDLISFIRYCRMKQNNAWEEHAGGVKEAGRWERHIRQDTADDQAE